jgi:hypothetical protein
MTREINSTNLRILSHSEPISYRAEEQVDVLLGGFVVVGEIKEISKKISQVGPMSTSTVIISGTYEGGVVGFEANVDSD